MEREEIIRLYDEQNRINGQYPDARREELPNVVRYISDREKSGFVLYSRLNESNADEAIRQQVDYFEGLGYDFEWKYFSHDTPVNLKDRLAAQDFDIGQDEAVMVLEISKAPAILLQPPSLDIRRVHTLADIETIIDLQQKVYPDEDFSWMRDVLGDRLDRWPETVGVYIATIDGQPAGASWIYYHLPSTFAGLYGGSTLPQFRSRGIYTGMVAARLQEAAQRGLRFLTVDASNMSRPILEKLGFQQIAISNPCEYTVKANRK